MEDGPQEWPKKWVRYPKHRRATLRDWQDNRVMEWTGRQGGPSQYNPELFKEDESVRGIETACIEGGVPISTTDHRKTFYMREPNDRIVGACSGELTHYVFAEWLISGEYHGRPISVKALEKLGVQI